MPCGQFHEVFRRKRDAAGQGLEQHHAQAVNVAADVGPQGRGEILGGEIVARAHDRTIDDRTEIRPGAGKTQIDERRMAVGRDVDVSRRNVAVHPTRLVQGGQRLGDLPRDP